MYFVNHVLRQGNQFERNGDFLLPLGIYDICINSVYDSCGMMMNLFIDANFTLSIRYKYENDRVMDASSPDVTSPLHYQLYGSGKIGGDASSSRGSPNQLLERQVFFVSFLIIVCHLQIVTSAKFLGIFFFGWHFFVS